MQHNQNPLTIATDQLHEQQQPSINTSMTGISNGSAISQSPVASPKKSPNVGKSGCLFVHKLHNMVFDKNYQTLITWNFHGTAFTVMNVDKFAKEVLPKHFKHNNFSSFVRQLNMYAFLKTNKSARGSRTAAEHQIWEFSHPKFLRDKPALLDEIKSTKSRKILELDKNSASNNSQGIQQLQNQLVQAISTIQSMQEQFTEVVRELNDLKRKGALHQMMMTNVLMFMKENKMNLQPQQFSGLEAAMKDPTFASIEQDLEIKKTNQQNDGNSNFGKIDFDFQSFDKILPLESKGDTMPRQHSNILFQDQQQRQMNSKFQPPAVQLFSFPSNTSPTQVNQHHTNFNNIQQKPSNHPQSSPYHTPIQSPYNAPQHSPYFAANHSPYVPPNQSPYNKPSQSPYNTPNQTVLNNSSSQVQFVSQQQINENILRSNLNPNN